MTAPAGPRGGSHRAPAPPPERTATPQAKKPWTVFLYLCGDHPDLAEAIEENLKQILSAGSGPGMHVLVQRDRAQQNGPAERYIVPPVPEGSGAPPPPIRLPIDSVNSGAKQTLLDFLVWGLDLCPSDRIAVVVGGMGLFEPSSVFRRGVKRQRLFSICDDSSSGDALDITDLEWICRELRAQRANDPDAAPVVDLLAFDMCHMQFLEVAYELERLVGILVASQTFVPQQGWDYTALLRAWMAPTARAAGADELARLLVDRGTAAYAANGGGDRVPAHPPLSALDLNEGRLDAITRTFDAVMLGMIQTVGEDLVWWGRDRVINYYPRHRPRLRVPSGDDDDFVYDLGELMAAIRDGMHDTAARPFTFWLSNKIVRARRNGQHWMLEPILDHLPLALADEAAAIASDLPTKIALAWDAQAPEAAEYARTSKDFLALMAQLTEPPTLAQLVDLDHGEPPDPNAPPDAAAQAGVEVYKRAVEAVLSRAFTAARHQLRPAVQEEMSTLLGKRGMANQVAKLAEQVLKVLGPAPPSNPPVVLCSAGEPYSGISLYRPKNLDEVGDLNYLDLRFHKRIHWAAYLAASNLISLNSRALWRLVSSLLSTASPTACEEVLGRLVGDDSVVGGLRGQLRTLATPPLLRLSLEPETIAVESHNGADERAAYRLRLDTATGGAVIAQQTTAVHEPTLTRMLKDLDTLLAQQRVATADAQRLDSLGQALGEDILQDLVARLDGVRRQIESEDPGRPPHLLLQIPPELMRYPWELMADQDRWLGEGFALGRQVFTDHRFARGIAGRRSGRLRMLIVGDPVLRFADHPPQLPGAAAEADDVAALLEQIVVDHPESFDFDRNADVHIGEDITGTRFRALLRGSVGADGHHRSYDIVHFAGHASFDAANPTNSAWLFSDGPLTALNLRNTLAWMEAPPRLIFANACGAAMDGAAALVGGSNHSDVSGLATALINQGVASFVGPLWPIHDAIARRLAKDFYTKLLVERWTVGLALRFAKLAVRSLAWDTTPKGPAVMFPAAGVGWASLVLYGDPTTTVSSAMSEQPTEDGPDAP